MPVGSRNKPRHGTPGGAGGGLAEPQVSAGRAGRSATRNTRRLPVAFGALLVSARTAYLMAGVSSVTFLGMVFAERYNIIPHQEYFSPFSGLQENPALFALTLTFTVISLYAFAALAGFLTGLIHRRQEELKQNMELLRRRNAAMIMLYRTSEALSPFALRSFRFSARLPIRRRSQ